MDGTLGNEYAFGFEDAVAAFVDPSFDFVLAIFENVRFLVVGADSFTAGSAGAETW